MMGERVTCIKNPSMIGKNTRISARTAISVRQVARQLKALGVRQFRDCRSVPQSAPGTFEIMSGPEYRLAIFSPEYLAWCVDLKM
ncbi:unnamed protein product [Scytosiphon promiscuus]